MVLHELDGPFEGILSVVQKVLGLIGEREGMQRLGGEARKVVGEAGI